MPIYIDIYFVDFEWLSDMGDRNGKWYDAFYNNRSFNHRIIYRKRYTETFKIQG